MAFSPSYYLESFLEAGLQASLAAMALLLLVWLGRRLPAPLRYGLLLVALAKFALPAVPAPGGLFPWLGESLAWPTGPGPAAVFPQPASSPAISATVPNPALEPATTTTSAPTEILFWLYGLVVISGLLHLLRQHLLLASWRRAGELCRDDEVLAELSEVAHCLGLRKVPELRLHRRALPPAAFGLRRPTISVPAIALQQLPKAELRAVLAHELAHHKRGDLWTLMIQRILGVVWWFNPIFHGLALALRRIREQCCDDLVLARAGVERSVYCRALVNTAALCREQGLHAAPALGLADHRHPLSQRLNRLLDGTNPSTRLGARGLLVLLVAAFLVLPGRPWTTSLDATPTATSTLGEDSEIRSLQELEVRRLASAFVLRSVQADPRLSLDALYWQNDSLWIESSTGPSSDALDAILRRGPFVQRTLPESTGDRSGLAGYGLRPSRSTATGTKSGLEASPALLGEEEVAPLLRGLKQTTEEQRGIALVGLRPLGPAETFGSHREWPISLEIEGSKEQRLDLLHRFSSHPSLVIEKIEPTTADRFAVEIRLVLDKQIGTAIHGNSALRFTLPSQDLSAIVEELSLLGG